MQTIYSNSNQTTATTGSQHIMSWLGVQGSWADGYDRTGTDDQWTQFSVDTTDWPNTIQWEKYWIKVSNQVQTQVHRFMFYWAGQEIHAPFEWNHIDQLTVNFAPIPEAREVSPEHFMKFLERIGHDDDYLRLQLGKQKQHWEALGDKPPWDPEKIAELEQHRVDWHERLQELEVVERKEAKKGLVERWGIEEIPPITPELLDQIEANSRRFLAECLSPEELEFFDEYGHCKIRSTNEPEIYYIVKAADRQQVERYKGDELTEKICIQSAWRHMPALDTCAMKVLLIKHAEDEFLRIGNSTRIR